ncbi:hypothetical protein KY330_03220 [Candidatus Woesearchaeota archaeon]|nr:hypothetical protein [Candidatus Woesearchaeota archaeon]
MIFREALNLLEKSSVFGDWKKDNKDYFLSVGFLTIDNTGAKQYPWTIGYYSPKEDMIVSFNIDKEVSIIGKDKVFKRPDENIFELDMKHVKLDLPEVIKKADDFQNEKYREIIVKTLLLVQNLENFGNVWNVTLVTKALNAINMKINASDGKILDDKMGSLMDLKV